MDGLSTNLVDQELNPFNFKPLFEDAAPRNDSEVRTMSDRPVLAGQSKSSRSSRMIHGDSHIDGTGAVSAPHDSGPSSQGRSLQNIQVPQQKIKSFNGNLPRPSQGLSKNQTFGKLGGNLTQAPSGQNVPNFMKATETSA